MSKASDQNSIGQLKAEIERLELENQKLKSKLNFNTFQKTVIVPDQFKEIFDEAEKLVSEYFSHVFVSPENGEILINGERYILIRSASLSFEFLEIIKELYSNYGTEEALKIGNNFLFDIGHVLGKKDAEAFHEKMKLEDPIHKLSAGPVHFAHSGWANVEILPDSSPTPDDQFFIRYVHHNSFEAQSWKKAGIKSDKPVCVMNAGYSSGWCEKSFGIPLTAVEICCEAAGDEHCTFVMAPPHKINDYLKGNKEHAEDKEYVVPVFFKRKYVEDKLRTSLSQKETLLKEVHHRVKNNLQIISSLFKLQMNNIEDERIKDEFLTCLNRVNTMAQVHELIYSDRDLSSINVEQYFRNLMSSLKQLYFLKNKEVEVVYNFDLSDSRFDPDKAIPLGLMINEMATNAFKYATNEKAVISFELKDVDDYYILTFSDNGPGLPDSFSKKSLGMSLIRILSDQIDAELKSTSTPLGLTYTIKFKK